MIIYRRGVGNEVRDRLDLAGTNTWMEEEGCHEA
jgi:hypothetical protein